MARDFLDLLRWFFNLGVDVGTPQVALAAGLAAQQRGKEQAAALVDALNAKLTHIATGSTEWQTQRPLLVARMEEAMDSFGVGLTEPETLTRLEAVYAHTIVSDFNGSRYSQMYSARSTETYPFWQFVSKRNKRVCTLCRPLDGRIFDKKDPWAGYVLPQVHYNCYCEAHNVTKDEAIRQPALLVRSAKRFYMNVQEELRYDKSNELIGGQAVAR